MNRLHLILQNKHTSGAAVLFVLANFLSGIGAIWVPEYSAQFKQTEELLESIAVGWGFLLSGDATSINPIKPPSNDPPAPTPNANTN